MKTFLNISEKHYKVLREHLFSGDEKESVAIALCGRNSIDDLRLLTVNEILTISSNDCYIREGDFVHWQTKAMIPFLEKAMNKKMSIVKIHCHPGGGEFFSKTDDNSDIKLFSSVYGWVDDNGPHGSLIMLPGGKLFGRFIEPDLSFSKIDRVRLIGNDIKIWDALNKDDIKADEFSLRTQQAFGKGTVDLLKKLRIAVVGCSGTGSPLIEMLTRLGVGELHLIDPDKIEKKNLNRIINSTMSDAKKKRFKVNVLKKAIGKIGIGTTVYAYSQNICEDMNLAKLLGTMDFIFGCVDSVEGRHIMNSISTFYLVPFIDVGVKLIADNNGGIDKICGTINYLCPGESLLARKVYNVERLRAEVMYRVNPKEYKEQKKLGYITNVEVVSPAVISLNTLISSYAANELLARLHLYRYTDNSDYATTRIDLTDPSVMFDKSPNDDVFLVKNIGRGDMNPFLNTLVYSHEKSV